MEGTNCCIYSVPVMARQGNREKYDTLSVYLYLFLLVPHCKFCFGILWGRTDLPYCWLFNITA